MCSIRILLPPPVRTENEHVAKPVFVLGSFFLFAKHRYPARTLCPYLFVIPAGRHGICFFHKIYICGLFYCLLLDEIPALW